MIFNNLESLKEAKDILCTGEYSIIEVFPKEDGTFQVFDEVNGEELYGDLIPTLVDSKICEYTDYFIEDGVDEEKAEELAEERRGIFENQLENKNWLRKFEAIERMIQEERYIVERFYTKNTFHLLEKKLNK